MAGPGLGMLAMFILGLSLPGLFLMIGSGGWAIRMALQRSGAVGFSLACFALNVWEPVASLVVPIVFSLRPLRLGRELTESEITLLLLSVPTAMLLPGLVGLTFRDRSLRLFSLRMLGMGLLRWKLWENLYASMMEPADQSPVVNVMLAIFPVFTAGGLWAVWEMHRFDKRPDLQAAGRGARLVPRFIVAAGLLCAPVTAAFRSLPPPPLAWKLDTERLASLEQAGGPDLPGGMTWSLGGLLAAGSSLWSVNSGTLVWREEPYVASALSFDGNRLAFTFGARGIYLLKTGACSFVPGLHSHVSRVPWSAYPGRFSFSADGRRVAWVNRDRALKVFDFAEGRLIGAVDQVDRIASITFSPNGQSIATFSEVSGPISLYRVPGLTLMQEIASHRQVDAVAFSPDGETIIAGGDDQGIKRGYSSRYRIKIWRLSDGKLLQSFETNHWFQEIAVHPGGKAIATAGRGGVWVWRLRDGAGNQISPEPSRRAVFSPDGVRLAFSTSRGVEIWRLMESNL